MKICFFIIYLFLSEQLFSQSINGNWQFQTHKVSDGYLDNYIFSDSTFTFNISDYDQLSALRQITGTFKIVNGTIFFSTKIIVVKKIVGVNKNINYSEFSEWNCVFGEPEIVKYNNTFSASFEYDPNNVTSISIDGRTYYKIIRP